MMPGVLKSIPLVYGSLYKFDGYVASFNTLLSDAMYSANLRDAFPKISEEAIPNCSEIGTLNAIVGMIGVLQANEVLKMVTNTGKPLVNQLLIYNVLENSQYTMKLKSTFTKEQIKHLFQSENYTDLNCEIQDESLLISSTTLRQKLSYGEAAKNLHIISVIENTNTKHPFEVHQKIPLSKFKVSEHDFNLQNDYVIVCNKGISSYIAMQQIKAVFPKCKRSKFKKRNHKLLN